MVNSPQARYMIAVMIVVLVIGTPYARIYLPRTRRRIGGVERVEKDGCSERTTKGRGPGSNAGLGDIPILQGLEKKRSR